MRGNLTLKFSFVQSFYYGASCIICGFLTPYYQDLGYDAFMIGVLSMVMSLSATFAQPFWGVACDRFGRIKRTFLFSAAASLPFACLLVAVGSNTVLLILSIFMLSVTFLSMSPIMDAWIMRLGNRGEPVNYSVARGFGSLLYGASAVVFGYVLDRTGMWAAPLGFVVLVLALLVASSTIRDPGPGSLGEAEKPSAWRCLAVLVKNSKYMVLVATVTAVFVGAVSIEMTFYPLLLRELGGGNTELGIGFSLMAFSEVPVMWFYGRIARRFRERDLICVALAVYLVKCLSVAAAPNVTLLLLAQLLTMFSFGLLLPSAVNYINKIVDGSALVTALVLYSSSTFGVGSIVGSLAGGAIADALGVRPMMYLLCLVVAAAAAAFIVLSAGRGGQAENNV